MYPNYETYVSYPEIGPLYSDDYRGYPETNMTYQDNYATYPGIGTTYQTNYKTYPKTGSVAYQTSYPVQGSDGDRFLGGALLAPFLLGGLTGAAVAPYFYNRPYYPYGPGCCPPYYGFY